jgi:uncharacterized protein (TIRG00374 family)
MDPNRPVSAKKRLAKWITTVLRAAVCAVALWWAFASVSMRDSVVLADGRTVTGAVVENEGGLVVSTADGSQRWIADADIARDAQDAGRVSYGLISVWRKSGKLLLVAGIGCFLLVPLLQGVRLRWLLVCQRIDLGLWQSVKLSFAGNFLNFAAPFGSTAGDVFKAYYAALHTSRKTEAATTVFIDRAVGLGTLLATVAFVALVTASTSRLAPLRSYLLVLTAVPVTGVLLYMSPVVRRARIVRAVVARLPKLDQLKRIDATAQTLLAQKGILLLSVVATVALQALAAATFVCIALALGMNVLSASALDIYAYFSAGEIVKAIPGPPQGLGTAELAYAYFFAGLGGASQIVSAAIGVRLVNLLCALPGLAVVATGAYRPRRGAGETLERPLERRRRPTLARAAGRVHAIPAARAQM